jgi:hypothetical protein
MSKIESFEDLHVYQSGLSMAIDLYKKLANCKHYSLKDQICRSAVSIPSNIAEGYERDYNKEIISKCRHISAMLGSLIKTRSEKFK